MLEFDSNHQSMNGSLKTKKGARIKNIVIGGIAVASILIFSGCSKDVPCDINQYHAHNYVSEQGFDRYIVSEKEKEGNLSRTDEYITITKDVENLINFENKEGLFRIYHNKEKINEITSSQNDYLEYRYSYKWVQIVPVKVGKVTIYNQIWHTGYSWTTNPNRSNLTGQERVVTHVYYGYKVVTDENGNFKAIQSETVDNIEDLPDDFIYIKSDFYKKVNFDNKSVEVDYEDGQEEDKPNYNKEKTEEYERQLEQEGRSKIKR